VDDVFLERLHREISETQQRRHKLVLLKITFVTALLGFGALKIGELVTFWQVLYLVPLVAFFFDLLIMGEHFSIRRMGSFLRQHSPSPLENEWEEYVRKRRDKFFKIGSYGFTILSLLAAIALLINTKSCLQMKEWLWFLVLFAFYVALVVYGQVHLRNLDK